MKKISLLAVCVLIGVSSLFAQQTEKQKLAAIKAHKEAVHIKDGWIRDPYIIIGPDDYYYLTGTTPNPGDPREQSDPYNTGLKETSIVGWKMQAWRSKDLVNWEHLGTPFTLEDVGKYADKKKNGKKNLNLLWAPEIHWIGDRWALVHCPQAVSSLALSAGKDLKGPWTQPNVKAFNGKHDPSLFKDDDGKWYLLWSNTFIQPIAPGFTGLEGEKASIDPADRKIGHEGATLRKIGNKYVHIGTAWSTDKGRKGSYNLYYCTADNITGPYSDRKFLGRFLGHGTPFQDKKGNWWCTAFFNGNVPPISDKDIQTRDLSEDAQTINKLGTTIVPLEVKVLKNGDIYMRAKDPRYSTPGPDEVQKFDK